MSANTETTGGPEGALVVAITRGLSTLIDPEDAELARLPWHAATKKRLPTSVPRVDVCRGRYESFARLPIEVAKRMGIYVSGLTVDHINGDTLDNRRSNLRMATSAQNNYNKGLTRKNTTGFKGVARRRRGGMFAVNIGFENGKRFLGHFRSAESAARVYDEWAKAAFGEFAWLNFPGGDR